MVKPLHFAEKGRRFFWDFRILKNFRDFVHSLPNYTLLFHSLFKVEFNIDHFVLGEHRER